MFLETPGVSIVVNLARIGGMQKRKVDRDLVAGRKPAGTHGDWRKRGAHAQARLPVSNGHKMRSPPGPEFVGASGSTAGGPRLRAPLCNRRIAGKV